MQERRDYFRIEDDIHLSYRALDPQERAKPLAERLAGRRPRHDIVEQINEISRRNAAVFKSVQKQQSEIARYLQSLNEKIDLLAAHAAGSDPATESHPNHHVSLSASGIAFGVDVALEVGSALELVMRLYPSHRQIIATGEVVDASRGHRVDSVYPLGVAAHFVEISESDHEALVEHILMRQFERRREARQHTEE